VQAGARGGDRRAWSSPALTQHRPPQPAPHHVRSPPTTTTSQDSHLPVDNLVALCALHAVPSTRPWRRTSPSICSTWPPSRLPWARCPRPLACLRPSSSSWSAQVPQRHHLRAIASCTEGNALIVRLPSAGLGRLITFCLDAATSHGRSGVVHVLEANPRAVGKPRP